MAFDFGQLEEALKTAKNSEIVKKDLRKAVRSVSTAITALQQAVSQMEEVLADDYQPVAKERKPRAASTGGAKRGRKPKNAQPAS
ncbi:hypothetical protein [Hymenobacter sp. BT730]|uniref:hypothetical protein n=1 Tax=Hymenobacter sp. BT730 TaxID=3063332 RepID=UPI0026DF2B43|nr:hypothetical protein [Hymenobacter sp. BT730]